MDVIEAIHTRRSIRTYSPRPVERRLIEEVVLGVALYSDQQAIDSTSPFGKAMIQMACVFSELEGR
jgi:hypothetical protein